MAKMVWVADDGTIHETKQAAEMADALHHNKARIYADLMSTSWATEVTSKQVSENATMIYHMLRAYFDPAGYEREANAAIDQLEREANSRG